MSAQVTANIALIFSLVAMVMGAIALLWLLYATRPEDEEDE